MEYLKLQCDTHDCKCSFLVALDEWYSESYGGSIPEIFTCPICGHGVWVEEINKINI
jgi:endogenous inhibitor of DNA gyrase (YacG/DUF329 family)